MHHIARQKLLNLTKLKPGSGQSFEPHFQTPSAVYAYITSIIIRKVLEYTSRPAGQHRYNWLCWIRAEMVKKVSKLYNRHCSMLKSQIAQLSSGKFQHTFTTEYNTGVQNCFIMHYLFAKLSVSLDTKCVHWSKYFDLLLLINNDMKTFNIFLSMSCKLGSFFVTKSAAQWQKDKLLKLTVRASVNQKNYMWRTTSHFMVIWTKASLIL